MAVIFWDFDGTLVYSNPLWSNSMLTALKLIDPNTKVCFNDIRKCMQTGFTWHSAYRDYSELTDEKWWEFMNSKFLSDYMSLGVKKDTAQNAVKLIRNIIKKEENYNLYPDTIDVLKKSISKGYKNVILSNNYPDLVEVLEKLELDKYFDNYIISAAVGYDKPRGEIFETAKALYPKESNFIMIGDNISADIIGGKNAGMKTILVHNNKSNIADFCFDNLKSVLNVL